MKRQPPKIPRPTPVPRVPGPLDERVFTAQELADFWAGPGASQPIISSLNEEECLATFCWREADRPLEQVLLFANRLTDETELPATLLTRMPGTDLFHATYRMRNDWRASYSFVLHERGSAAPWQADDQVQIRQILDRGLADPRNRVTCQNRAGLRQSVVELPGAPAQPWLAAPIEPIAAGSTTEFARPDGRTVWIHDPAGHDHDAPLPVVVVLDGEVWVRPEQGLLASADRMIAAGAVPPFRLVLTASGGRDARWSELAADGRGVSDLTEALMPWLAGRRALPEPTHRAVAGQSLGGLTALRAGLMHPEVFGAAISHSASLWQEDLLDGLPEPGEAAPAPARVFLAHGSQEWVLDPPHRELANAAERCGLPWQVSVHNGGHDYAWWRGGLAEGIEWWLTAGP